MCALKSPMYLLKLIESNALIEKKNWQSKYLSTRKGKTCLTN